MVVRRQHEQQDFAGSLQRPQVLDLTSHSHDIRQHLTIDTQQEPPVANLQQIDQQVINRPQPVKNSHRQDITPVTSDDMPNDHVRHFPPSVQHDIQYPDSDTSDASPYRQTRNKRRSAPAYLSDHSHRAFSPMRSARTSPAHSRHSSRRSLTARESQSESETDSEHSRKESSTKGVSVGTLGTAHLLRCIVKIQDKEVNALIDTGSEVTILNDSVFETLAEKPYIIRETTMHGAGRDMLMTCRITNPVEFSIQHLTFNERLYVAPIDCDMLLGADFLIKHSAILDVPAKKLTLKNTVVELILGGEPTPVPMVNRVTVHETIIIPPNTAMRIDLNTEDVTSDYLIEPKGNSTLLIPRTVYHPVKHPKGDEEGYTQEVSVIQSLEDQPLPSVGTCTTNSKTKNSSKPGIPSHLKDLYVDSGSNLSKSQQTLLRQLLLNHGAPVFNTQPETLALLQAPDNNQDVFADVTCNQDLTVSAPTQKQQEVNNT
ncbi:unnamed protein product [Mytilus edulis]|uniref:Peptidase A2 domain-containing protein n=1 Tax=Mytilus edulis TaxID=6550 RepID=A0A8S3QB32_MYTED|nr:unnamed protein product [Mytilus edulis]